MKRFLIISIMLLLVASVGRRTSAQSPKKVGTIEGITEYRFDNGCRLLLFPDQSKPEVTVNMTVFVGSRHEGYGETGMAHLLEHLLFKGTPKHTDIPKEFKEIGATNFNGTTWYDRTNYYETVPASDENLEWAIELEADRLVNSFVAAEDLASEMTVVRNEFEIGENSPLRILMQRIMANAYEWHNYGKSTIGNRADLERVPIYSLKRFYKKFYQPDNIMVVVAGKFKPELALELVQKHFGVLEKPTRELEKTYTEEPAQDGERVVNLRRVGDVAMVGIGYHIPAAANSDYAAVQVLSNILGTEPSGRLYTDLVKEKKAASVNVMDIAGHDPGMLLCFAEVLKGTKPAVTRDALAKSIDNLAKNGVTDEEVKRAIGILTKQREDLQANTSQLAIQLSEWAAYGDWRLFFLHRDRLEKVTASDVQRVATNYLRDSNRTIGMFLPTTAPQRTTVPATGSIAKMVDGYKGRAKLAEGEVFDPTPENIQKRTIVGRLDSGIKYALLPKKTKGERVYMTLTLRFGNEKSLSEGRLVDACSHIGRMMTRGTKDLSYQELKDKLRQVKTTITGSSSPGSATFSISTRRKYADAAIDLLQQVLREPSFPEKEFEIGVRKQVTRLESNKSNPQALAIQTLMRKMMPFPEDDIRYTPTIEESIERLNALKIDDVIQLYNEFVNGQHGELTVVGDFDPDSLIPKLNEMFTDWNSMISYERIAIEPKMEVPGEMITINTPDKANAIYVAGLVTDVRDDDEDYEAMYIGNNILGGGALANRLAKRVRDEDGLSYAVGSQFQADKHDRRGMFLTFAMTNPKNREKVIDAIREETERLVDSGVNPEELEKAKEGLLKQLRSNRGKEATMMTMLQNNLETGRDMSFIARRDARIESLTKEAVDKAVKKLIDMKRLIIVTAGDFEKAKAEAEAEKKKSEEGKEKPSDQPPKVQGK